MKAKICAGEFKRIIDNTKRFVGDGTLSELMRWTDEYFDRAAMLNSDSQLYKQAGNGVTVSVIQAIAERL